MHTDKHLDIFAAGENVWSWYEVSYASPRLHLFFIKKCVYIYICIYAAVFIKSTQYSHKLLRIKLFIGVCYTRKYKFSSFFYFSVPHLIQRVTCHFKLILTFTSNF